MDNLVCFLVAVLVIGFFVRSYLKGQKKGEEEARSAAEDTKVALGPTQSLAIAPPTG
jgi:hypothetical protein